MTDVSITYPLLIISAVAYIAAAFFTASNIFYSSINRILKVFVSVVMISCFGYLFMSITKAGLSDTTHPLTVLALFSCSLIILYLSFGTLRFFKEERNDDYYESQIVKSKKRKQKKRL